MHRLPAVAARGVYYLPWTGADGELYLAAVTAGGRRIATATVEAGQDPTDAEDLLWEILEEEDPVPMIHLVR